MAKLIKITVTYKMQRASEEVCKRFNRPLGSIELLDSDNFRDSFHATEAEAIVAAQTVVEDALGLSGGIALGAVEVEVTDAVVPK